MPRPAQAGAGVERAAALAFGARAGVLRDLAQSNPDKRFLTQYRRVYSRSRDRGEVNAALLELWPRVYSEARRMLGVDRIDLTFRDVSLDSIIREIMIGLDTLARSFQQRVLLGRKQGNDTVAKDYGIAQRAGVRLARRLVTDARYMMFKQLYQQGGAQRFRWITERDKRVRPTHAALDGRTFYMSQGASGIYPGQQYNCRCLMEPLFQ